MLAGERILPGYWRHKDRGTIYVRVTECNGIYTVKNANGATYYVEPKKLERLPNALEAIDEGLEKEINRIISTPNNLNIPDPIEEIRAPYGYRAHRCPLCNQYCLIRGGGYAKHYVKMHDPGATRQKARAIIKAVRSYDKKHLQK